MEALGLILSLLPPPTLPTPDFNSRAAWLPAPTGLGVHRVSLSEGPSWNVPPYMGFTELPLLPGSSRAGPGHGAAASGETDPTWGDAKLPGSPGLNCQAGALPAGPRLAQTSGSQPTLRGAFRVAGGGRDGPLAAWLIGGGQEPGRRAHAHTRHP